VRVFKGRDSVGVRGIKLADTDQVVSMAILRHVEIELPEARAYLKQAAMLRRASGEEGEAEAPIEEIEEDVAEAALSPDRYAALSAAEQFILSVSEQGFGKRTSAFEYRTANRGGQGITAMAVTKRNGPLVASFPVEESDQLMLITDLGQTIRVPVHQIRIAGRATQGVTLFRTAEGERVVSVDRIADAGGAEDEG
jgi:DNA gyrase subunit A